MGLMGSGGGEKKVRGRIKTNLIRHDHDLAIAQGLEGIRVTVVLFVLQTEDLDDVVDLSVLHNLQEKTPIRTSNDTKDGGEDQVDLEDHSNQNGNRRSTH